MQYNNYLWFSKMPMVIFKYNRLKDIEKTRCNFDFLNRYTLCQLLPKNTAGGSQVSVSPVMP